MKTYTNVHAYKQLLSKDFNIEKCCISNLLSLPDKYVTKNICVHIYNDKYIHNNGYLFTYV